jgi:hypothetical protein
MVVRIAIPDVVELEQAIKADEPACEAIKQLCKWWVDVEVIFSFDIETGKFSEMNLVEADHGCQLLAWT